MRIAVVREELQSEYPGHHQSFCLTLGLPVLYISPWPLWGLGLQPWTELSHFSHVWLLATPRTVVARLLCPWAFPGTNPGVGWTPRHPGSPLVYLHPALKVKTLTALEGCPFILQNQPLPLDYWILLPLSPEVIVTLNAVSFIHCGSTTSASIFEQGNSILPAF